jgi:hypothetical protein
VALPSNGQHFDSSQTTIDLIAVGYSLGLASSVLWFGALATGTGKLMLIWGTVLAIPGEGSHRLDLGRLRARAPGRISVRRDKQ